MYNPHPKRRHSEFEWACKLAVLFTMSVRLTGYVWIDDENGASHVDSFADSVRDSVADCTQISDEDLPGLVIVLREVADSLAELATRMAQEAPVRPSLSVEALDSVRESVPAEEGSTDAAEAKR